MVTQYNTTVRAVFFFYQRAFFEGRDFQGLTHKDLSATWNIFAATGTRKCYKLVITNFLATAPRSLFFSPAHSWGMYFFCQELFCLSILLNEILSLWVCLCFVFLSLCVSHYSPTGRLQASLFQCAPISCCKCTAIACLKIHEIPFFFINGVVCFRFDSFPKYIFVTQYCLFIKAVISLCFDPKSIFPVV